mmetsp:Transcript_17571/g.56652  ORF Transcript_17571/g.56652 Transcript_17571/m.56652 type:complete len:274 (+) Transcript_17571:3734-4555(+)
MYVRSPCRSWTCRLGPMTFLLLVPPPEMLAPTSSELFCRGATSGMTSETLLPSSSCAFRHVIISVSPSTIATLRSWLNSMKPSMATKGYTLRRSTPPSAWSTVIVTGMVFSDSSDGRRKPRQLEMAPRRTWSTMWARVCSSQRSSLLPGTRSLSSLTPTSMEMLCPTSSSGAHGPWEADCRTSAPPVIRSIVPVAVIWRARARADSTSSASRRCMNTTNSFCPLASLRMCTRIEASTSTPCFWRRRTGRPVWQLQGDECVGSADCTHFWWKRA